MGSGSAIFLGIRDQAVPYLWDQKRFWNLGSEICGPHEMSAVKLCFFFLLVFGN